MLPQGFENPLSLTMDRPWWARRGTNANTTNKCRPGAHRAPINILGIDYHQYCSSSVWKAFNVGINTWNITAVLYSNGDQTRWICHFSSRSFRIHFKVYQMWPACYSCWFNWRNSITRTHCNVMSLEHDSIPWRAKSQRIDVDATSFHFLWQLFTIIEIFSRRFELDEECENLPKTNQIWTINVLWGWLGWYTSSNRVRAYPWILSKYLSVS